MNSIFCHYVNSLINVHEDDEVSRDRKRVALKELRKKWIEIKMKLWEKDEEFEIKIKNLGFDHKNFQGD